MCVKENARKTDLPVELKQLQQRVVEVELLVLQLQQLLQSLALLARLGFFQFLPLLQGIERQTYFEEEEEELGEGAAEWNEV
jgi:hypothetical protein